MPRQCLFFSILGLALGTMVSPRWDSSASAEVVAKQSAKGMAIEIDHSPFTEYLIRSGAKPILWPILGPTNQPMTRAYPMGEIPGEKKDHVHQRSLWFSHGDVNGVSFWDEQAKHGTIVHRRFVEVKNGAEATLTTENDWIGPDNKKILLDERRLRFGAEDNVRWIDFDITLKASSGPVKFGDTKEGTFGVRVYETMRADASDKKRQQDIQQSRATQTFRDDAKKGGRIINSEGQTDLAAWGRKAAWVDYHGPVGGQTVGIAIMNHPDSFRFPTFWHVRTYGLFAANPFGRKEFPDGGKQDGSYTLPEGKTLTLRYRVWLHKGDEKEGRVAAAYQSYAGQH